MRTPRKHHGTCVEGPWKHHRSPMGTPCKSHESLMGTPRKHLGNLKVSWEHHGTAVGLRTSHGASVMFRWDCRGIGNFVALPWGFRGTPEFTMVLPWCSHATPIFRGTSEFPWDFPGASMILPRSHYTFVEFLWDFYGTCNHPRRFRDVPMGLPCESRGTSEFPWYFRDDPTGLPWEFHRSAEGMSKFPPSGGGARHANTY